MSFRDLAKAENALKDDPSSKPKDALPAEQPVKKSAVATEGPPARKS